MGLAPGAGARGAGCAAELAIAWAAETCCAAGNGTAASGDVAPALARDGPGGSPRRVQRAEGIEHVIVGGEPVFDHGQHTGALPGRVLRAPRRA